MSVIQLRKLQPDITGFVSDMMAHVAALSQSAELLNMKKVPFT
jgi:hypothetical protein